MLIHFKINFQTSKVVQVFFMTKLNYKMKPICLSFIIIFLITINVYVASGKRPAHKARLISLFIENPDNLKKFDFRLTKTATDIALEKVNRIYSNIQFELIHKCAHHTCHVNDAGAFAAEEHLIRGPVSAFIGPGNDAALDSVARIAAHYNLPVCTGGGLKIEFDNQAMFPTLVRLSVTINSISDNFIKVLNHFNWHHIVILCDIRNYFYVNVRDGLEKHLNSENLKNNFTIYFEDFSFKTKTRANLTQILIDCQQKARVIVILGDGEVVREVMISSYFVGMNNNEYAFITIELFKSQIFFGNFHWYRPKSYENDIARKMYRSLLIISMRFNPKTQAFLQFQQSVVDRAKWEYNFTFDQNSVSVITAGFHDCILIYAKALNWSLYQNGSGFDGRAIVGRLRNFTFKEGVSGDFFIDEKGDRQNDFNINDMNPNSMTMKPVAMYDGVTGELKLIEGESFYWPGNKKPEDVPLCGFDGLLCKNQPSNSNAWKIILIIFSIIAIVWPISYFLYKKYRLEVELSTFWWKIDWNEISFDDIGRSNSTVPKSSTSTITVDEISYKAEHNFGPMNTIGITNQIGGRSPKLTIPPKKNTPANKPSANSHQCIASLHTTLSKTGHGTGNNVMYGTRIGTFKGTKVAVKIMNMEKISITRQILMELKQVKDLVHENLIHIIGLCIDPNIALISELCSRGSLQELLLNDSFSLDWSFRYSIMSDIVDGMNFIHNSVIRYHGRLKSSNCVINKHFVVKLTDFGLNYLLSNVSIEDKLNSRSLFWVAPEHLRKKDPLVAGSQKGDVYSFAIIIQEIVTRTEPYDTDNMHSRTNSRLSPEEILNLIRMSLEPPFRPIVQHVDNIVPQELINLMEKSWSENPSQRPTFANIKTSLKRLGKSFGSSNLLDNLLRRMEQYTDNLEQLVEEKTSALIEEKKRSDELLHELLPKYVVYQLKNGNQVEPEEFECVSICFTDIVDFTKIAAESKPIEVVDLLNDVYTCFDSIISNYDVYKVETIGDAYMVVSGVPQPNGHKHGREIARMSLDLLHQIDQFQIKHKPDQKLMLRIGVHSGPVATGVVGSRMPRYCLFGDTVNTASRMESHGEAMKIHISESTKVILDTFNKFEIVERGLIDIKGKGLMQTYWLISEARN